MRLLPEAARRWIAESILGFDLGSDPDPDAAEWRRLGDGKALLRNLDPRSQEEMQRICFFLYDSNPLGGWIVDQRVELLVGGELGYTVELDAKRLGLEDTPARVQDLADTIKQSLDRFWDHPVHNLRQRADEYLTTFMVGGELCLPIAAVNPVDGIPTLDYIDPAQIAAVVPFRDSALVPGTVVLKPASPGAEPKRLAVVIHNPETGRLEGECFFFGNARLLNAMRGRSELLRQADWIDALDQFLFARADRAVAMNAHLWDVTLKAAGKTRVKERSAEIRKDPPLKPGTVRVHNEQEVWQAVTPDLKAADASDEVRLFRNYILGSKSMPESWFADAGEVTRTTAGEQNDVALMTLKAWRKRARGIFATLLNFAYDSLQAKQPALPARVEGGVRLGVALPPLGEKDVSRIGGVLQNIEAALAAAELEALISRRTARKVFLHAVDKLGVTVDPDDEARQIEIERGEQERRAQAQADAVARARLAGLLADGDEDERVPGPVGAAAMAGGRR